MGVAVRCMVGYRKPNRWGRGLSRAGIARGDARRAQPLNRTGALRASAGETEVWCEHGSVTEAWSGRGFYEGVYQQRRWAHHRERGRGLDWRKHRARRRRARPEEKGPGRGIRDREQGGADPRSERAARSPGRCAQRNLADRSRVPSRAPGAARRAGQTAIGLGRATGRCGGRAGRNHSNHSGGD